MIFFPMCKYLNSITFLATNPLEAQTWLNIEERVELNKCVPLPHYIPEEGFLFLASRDANLKAKRISGKRKETWNKWLYSIVVALQVGMSWISPCLILERHEMVIE
jgi:hypothetical protein